MADFSQTRSEYLKIMMGERKDALAPYRPEQMNDLGDTSFDVASLSDDDINNAIKNMTGTQYEGTDVFKSLQTEQTTRQQKAEQANRDKPWYEAVGDFFSNIGTSITEGVLNVVDNIWDFTIGLAGGIAGGWYGQQNDFTDWVSKAMTDDRWVDYTTKALTQIDVFDKGFWTNEGGYWSDWSYANIKAEQERDYEGMEWLHTGGNWIGYILPSLVLAYFTGGASIGVQAAAQGGLALASGMGEAQSRALSEGASYQEATLYGLAEGGINGAIAAISAGVGGTLAKAGGSGIVKTAGQNFGKVIGAKLGSQTAQVIADKSLQIGLRVAGSAGTAAVRTAFEPALQMIYDDNAWYNAYGTEENRKRYGEVIAKSALTAAAGSMIVNTGRELFSIAQAGSFEQYKENYFVDLMQSEALKAMSPSDRKAFIRSQREYLDNQREISKIQERVDQMRAKGATDAEIQAFAQSKMQTLAPRIEAWSDKYQDFYSKLSYQFGSSLDNAQQGMTEAQLNSAAMRGANRFAGMLSDLNTGSSLKASLIKLGSSIASRGGDFNFNQNPDGSGQAQVGTALISYNADSDDVYYGSSEDSSLPTVKASVVDGRAVLMPATVKEMQTIASLIKDPTAAKTLPTNLVLPLRTGNLTVDIKDLSTEQITKLALLGSKDFTANESGALVADLGGGKSLVLKADGTSGQIIDTAKTAEWTEPIALASAEVSATATAIEPTEVTPTGVKPLNLDAEPSVVKQAAQGKVGKVYSLTSAKSMVSAIEDSIQDLLSLDNLGGKTKLALPKGATAKELFDTLNLGTEEQKADLKEYLRTKLLDMNVGYELKSYYGEVLESYSGSWKDFLGTMDAVEVAKFNSDFDEFYSKLLASGEDSDLTKIINEYADKLSEWVNAYKELKSQTKTTGHIEKHRTKVLRRYWHNDGTDFGPDFDFDTKGYRSVLQPLHDIEQTSNKQSYTGSSTIKAFTKFLENYKLDNFTKKNDAGEIIATSSIYNQGLRDLANLLVESIEANSYTDKNGNVRYRALTSEQLQMLRLFQDEVEAMPKRFTQDTLNAVSNAKAAYHGVERYVSQVIKGSKAGIVRNFIQGYSERYANQLDTLMYEIGDNELSKSIYNELYLAQAQAAGMRDDFQTKIKTARDTYGVTNKKWNAKSSIMDSAGKAIEMKYLVRIYQHMLSGEESNNVKYIEANTIYIKNAKGKLVHIVKLSYSDMANIENELSSQGLLDYCKALHQLESGDLGDIYDQDYIRDTHIPNSNRMKEYTAIKLESNRSELGKAYVKSGVAKYGQQKDRVEKIPTGVHLVVEDPEISLMSQVSNQANIHFNDPVLQKINGMLNTRLDKSGTTVKQYLIEHNPGGLKLIDRAIRGAYGLPAESGGSRLIDFAGNGYVMTLIGFNPGSILRQPLSIMWSNDIRLDMVLRFTLAANLNPRIWRNSTRLIGEIEKEFPELRLRGKKNEALMGNAAADAITKVQSVAGKISGFGLKVTDAWTVGHEAVGLLSIQAQNLGYGEVGTPENDEYVKYHYRAFYATQVSTNRVTMSGARAGYYRGLGKLTSFMTGAVQGQIGYLLRASQQIHEYGGKTQQYYDEWIARATEAEENARIAYEEAREHLEETQRAYDEGTADRDDVKAAKEDFKEKFDEYSEATGERADAETSAKGFKHYSDMGKGKGVIISRLAAMFLTGLSLVAISELTSRLKGQKAWNEFDASSAGIDLALNSTVGWLPVARDLINAWKGYDLDIPEYAMVRQAYDFIGAIGAVAKDPSDKNARALLRQTIVAVSAFLGIPTSNLWKYANGIIKTFSPATALQMNNLLYGASYTSLTSTAKEYALKNDVSTAADLYQALYATFKTGEIEREVAVEEAKLVQEGFNPIARNIPDYIQNEEGEKTVLSDDQKIKFAKSYARANEQISKLIKSSKYKSMNSETKAKHIKKVYDLYYELAKHEALNIEPDSRLGKLLAYTGGDYDIANALLLIQQNAELQDTKRLTKKEQAVRLVNKQSMTKVQKLLTLYLMGYGVSSENKKLVQRYLISLGFSKKQAEEFIPSSK